MPRGDRTGPVGIGMRTGRGAGYCGGEDRPGNATAGIGFRGGRGLGRGCGFRETGADWGFREWLHKTWESAGPRSMRYGTAMAPYGRPDPEMEKRMLERQAEDLQIQLDAVRRRIGEIEAPPSSS